MEKQQETGSSPVPNELTFQYGGGTADTSQKVRDQATQR